MAHKKTRYRAQPYAAGGAVPLEVEIDSPRAHIAADIATADLLPAVEAMEKARPDEDASIAFQKQIDALKRSEDIQRERQATVPTPQTFSREERIQDIRQRGASLDHINFLLDNPMMLDNDNFNTTAKAHWAAINDGHEVDTPSYFNAMKKAFEGEVSPPAPTRRERKSRSELPDSEPSRAWVSAPVSRGDIPSASYPDRPGRITLSLEQRAMAKTLGQSEADYARGLLEMREKDREFGR